MSNKLVIWILIAAVFYELLQQSSVDSAPDVVDVDAGNTDDYVSPGGFKYEMQGV